MLACTEQSIATIAKLFATCLIVPLLMSVDARAQGTPNPASTTSARVPTPRPPHVSPPRGSDAGAGVPCDRVTSYGEVQPPGPPPTTYGPGVVRTVPTAAEAPVSPPAMARPAGTAGGGLGAAGAASRNIQIPGVRKLAFVNVEPPHPPVNTEFSNVAGVGLLSNGHLIVSQRLPMYPMLEYDEQNRLVRSFDANIVGRAHGMRIDSSDNIWLTDQACHTVIKLDSRGDVLMTLGTKGKAGTWDEAKGDQLFNQPTDVAFAANGDVYVTTGHGGPDPRVLRFDKRGRFVTGWSMKHADGSAATIHTIVVAPNGLVYVGDREVRKLRVFDRNGRSVRDIQMKNLVCGLYVDRSGRLWMTSGQDGMVMQLDWDGNILAWTGQEGFGSNDFGEAHYMVMTPDMKTIYVSDTVNNDVKRLQAN